MGVKRGRSIREGMLQSLAYMDNYNVNSKITYIPEYELRTENKFFGR